MPVEQRLRRPGKGRTVSIAGDIYRFLALGEETNGRYAQWEAFLPPGGGPRVHIHSREDEGFFVVEGEITVQQGDETTVVGPGTFVQLPVGIPHGFKNLGTEMARLLITAAPAGLEHLFFEAGVELAEGSREAVPFSDEEKARVRAASERYGITFVEKDNGEQKS